MRREPNELDEADEHGGEDEAEDGFTPLGTASEPVAVVPPSVARSGYLVYRGEDGFEAAVPTSLVDRCVAWGRKAAPNEWYGLVVGKLCEHGGRRHVVVLGVVPDPEAEGRPSSVKTTSNSEFRTRMSARVLYPDGIVLGWAHGHLKHGIRFSAVDRANQRTWTQPHSLGIVVDPWHAERVSVYRGPDSELLTLVGDAPAPELSSPPRRRPVLRHIFLRTAAARVSSGAKRVRRFAVWSAVVVGLALAGRYGWRVSERLDALEAKSAGSVGQGTRPEARGAAPVSSEPSASANAGICREGEEAPGHGTSSGGS